MFRCGSQWRAARIDPSCFTRPLMSLESLINKRGTMPKTKLAIIKAFLGVNYLPDGKLLPCLIAAHDGVFGHPTLFPNTPFDGPTFKAGIDRFATAVAAVLLHVRKLSLE